LFVKKGKQPAGSATKTAQKKKRLLEASRLAGKAGEKAGKGVKKKPEAVAQGALDAKKKASKVATVVPDAKKSSGTVDDAAVLKKKKKSDEPTTAAASPVPPPIVKPVFTQQQ
jgi:hypothetical protein